MARFLTASRGLDSWGKSACCIPRWKLTSRPAQVHTHSLNAAQVLNHTFSSAVTSDNFLVNKRVHRLGNLDLTCNLTIDEGENKVCYTQTSRLSRAAWQRQPCVNSDWLCQWEMAIFDPPQNSHPLTDHQKIRRPLRLCQIWCKSVHGGLLGKWMK